MPAIIGYDLNLLILSRYDRLGASSRLRMLQYVPALEKSGFNIAVESLFDDSYLIDFYAGRRNVRSILSGYWRRFMILLHARDIDVIWLEKEAFPWFPASLELLFFPKNIPIVTDYDDAVFHRYDNSSSTVIRLILGKKIAHIMKNSRLVISGNAYLGEYASRAIASCVEIVPTVVDIETYHPLPDSVTRKQLTVGWIGTPETWNGCAKSFTDAIGKPIETHHARLLGVGMGQKNAELSWMEARNWLEENEGSDICEMDIGIMPLPNTPWMQGKCGYKLIQYMAGGLPVVASPVGVNKDIVEHGVNGFLAETDQEWRLAIETLLSDANLRHRMGTAGRKKVEERYSLQVWGPRVAQMLRHVAVEGHKP